MKKGSETKLIKRSEINLNPYNPKHHSAEDVKRQKANIRRVGLLGGIVWNESTGNLLDGHRRIEACDQIKKYDGTPDTDYEVKVEAVDFDEKTEKEQLTYMAVANTKADYNEIAKYIDDIDFNFAGLSEQDAEAIKQLQDTLDEELDSLTMPDYGDEFMSPIPKTAKAPVTELITDNRTTADIQKQLDEKPKMSVEEVKAEKRHCDNVVENNQANIDTYVFLDFGSVELKMAFCEILGVIPEKSMRIAGEDVLRLIE